MKGRIMLALVAGWLALAAAPVLAQSRTAVAPAVSTQVRAAVADAGHARVVVSLRPQAGFFQAGLSSTRALRMAPVEAAADSVPGVLPSGHPRAEERRVGAE